MPDEAQSQPFTLPDDILPRLRSREEGAYRELVKHAFGPMVRFAHGFVHSYDLASDVVQEVFVRIVEMGERFDPQGPLVAYLYAAVRNRALNMLRGENREAARAVRAATVMPQLENSGQSEPDSNMGEFLAMLTELQSTAIRLRFVEQRTIPEIAHTLGISVTSTERLIRRALSTLKARMSAE